MSGANADRRDRAVVVGLLVPDELWVHSEVVCIRRQVALFAYVRHHLRQTKWAHLPCQVAHEPVVCARSGGGAGGGIASTTGPAGGGSDFLRRRLNLPRWGTGRHPPRGGSGGGAGSSGGRSAGGCGPRGNVLGFL
jgi:hypothetical protein